MLWSGDKAWRQSGERRMLCGLQLPGPNNQQLAFKGKVADIDQSKVWPAGTCLGIDPSTNQPTDIPIDCAAPHAMEVTGAVNLAEKFPTGLPPEPEQDGFIKDACTRMTDAYLAPIQLRSTTLTLIYSTISLPSWSAGSHQVSCSIGATLGNGGWSTLLNSAKGPLMINGQPPVPPPDIPEERLNFPPIPMPDEPRRTRSSSGRPTTADQSDYSEQTQHMPQQSTRPTDTDRPDHATPAHAGQHVPQRAAAAATATAGRTGPAAAGRTGHRRLPPGLAAAAATGSAAPAAGGRPRHRRHRRPATAAATLPPPPPPPGP